LKGQAATGADVTYVRNLFQFIFPSLLESLKEEIDLEILVSSIASFNESLDFAGENTLSNEQVQAGFKVIFQLIDDVKERRRERDSKKEEEDHDDEEEERIEDEALRDDEILSGLAEVMGNFTKYYKNAFLPLFAAEGMTTFLEFLKSPKPEDRQTALCVFDDIVDYAGADSIPFFQHFMGPMIASITDADASVRQAAVYGIGCCAQVGGEQLGPFIPDILQRLVHVITQADSRTEKYILSTENAISAVGKICTFQAKAVDTAKTLQLWLSWLPVKEDNVESKVTYGQLLSFVESMNPHIIGPNYANVPHILAIFGEILGTDLIDETLAKRIVNALKQLQTSVPADVITKSWTSLNPTHQQKLQQAIST